MITVPVTVTASDQNGNPVANARIIATLDTTEIYQGFVVPEQVEAYADVSGVAVLQLWPNALGVAGSRYKVRAWNPDTSKRFLDVLAAVPNNACNLHEILVQEPYPPIDAAQQALIAAQAALAPVTEQAAIATAAAEAAEADRLQADLDAQATAADRLQTGLDRQATANDRIATGQDRVATGQDRTATGDDRLQTGLDRVATGQDRTQTGQDRTAASQSAGDALLSEQAAAASAALIGPPIIPAFANSAAAAPGVAVESAAVTVSGSTSTVWPAVVRGDGTPEVQVNAGPWASSAIFRAGDTIKLRNVSPPVGLNYIANLYAHSFVGVWSLSVFSPSLLFAANEPGVWYDPSDMSTMFQDAAGTTPVTAVEQPVGLMLDKSKGLVLGPELVVNGDFSDGTAGWVVREADASLSVTDGVATLTQGAVTDFCRVYRAITCEIGKWYEVSVEVTAVSSTISPRVHTSFTGTPGVPTWFGGNLATPSTVKGRFLAPATTLYIIMMLPSANGASGSIDNISVRELPGNHATQPTATARPVLQIDGNGKHRLRFDGVDDFLVTNTITPGTDKVQVFAGVRKLSDAARGVILESSASIDSNNGALLLTAPDGASATYAWDSKGTAISEAIASGFAAPTTSVLSGLGDISGDTSTIRVNGAQAATSVTDQGTGNYLAYPLYIGRRGGTTLPFNGWLYSMIVRFGSNMEADQITQTEDWVNEKTGAY